MNSLQPIVFGKEKYIYLSAEKSHQLAFKLASTINEKISSGGLKKPEVIIGIARGAIAWIKTIADWLNIEHLSLLRIAHYTNISQRLPEPVILEPSLLKINNKRVLLFDNVVETGKTLKLAIDYLNMSGAQSISTTTLFYKESSILKPDFYGQKTDSWIIFYFDTVETVKFLGTRWLNQGLELKDIKKRFLKIGLPKEEVNQAMKIIFNFVI